jgi:hypothetical protein
MEAEVKAEGQLFVSLVLSSPEVQFGVEIMWV